MNVQTYLFFDRCCEAAIQFYGEVFGAEVTFMMRFKDGPPVFIVPGAEDKIFHATMKFGETAVNMSDVVGEEQTAFGGFALLAHLTDVEEAERVFLALKIGGHVKVPLEQAFWAKRYGIVTDRFGVMWKIQVNN